MFCVKQKPELPNKSSCALHKGKQKTSLREQRGFELTKC